MSWRVVVISKRAKLDVKLGSLVVRFDSDNENRIHLSEIAVLVIEDTSVALTVSLLAALSKEKVKVVFCDEKRNPSSELISYYGCHDDSLKIKNQIDWLDESKTNIWTEIVVQKIKSQISCLKYIDSVDYKRLEPYVDEIELGDVTNREAMAAKVYFHGLFGIDFVRDDNSNINAALNYGYTILLSAFNREIVSNGYLTQLGIHHKNGFNHFNLSSDLMEPFRILVDKKVLCLLSEYDLKFDGLTSEIKYKLIDVLNTQVYIEGKQYYLLNAISIYCKSVFDALEKNDRSLIKFYDYEL